MNKTVLITGACGMIGSAVVKGALAAGYRVVGVDRRETDFSCEHYDHAVVDLSDAKAVKDLVAESGAERIIHLAALAHSTNGKAYSWEEYKQLNVDCAQNVFDAAGDIPVLFISTVDVFGFTKGMVTVDTEPKPVSHYAKSKVMAEALCKQLSKYTIFRLSPVYTDTIKRDIQKRYYLKYPKIAYRIGKGTEYEILHIDRAVSAIVSWCGEEIKNDLRIVKDPERMNTADYIRAEKAEGRAKCVFYIPKWIVKCGYAVLKALTGKNKYTYLLYKAVCPLRSE